MLDTEENSKANWFLSNSSTKNVSFIILYVAQKQLLLNAYFWNYSKNGAKYRKITILTTLRN